MHQYNLNYNKLMDDFWEQSTGISDSDQLSVDSQVIFNNQLFAEPIRRIIMNSSEGYCKFLQKKLDEETQKSRQLKQKNIELENNFERFSNILAQYVKKMKNQQETIDRLEKKVNILKTQNQRNQKQWQRRLKTNEIQWQRRLKTNEIQWQRRLKTNEIQWQRKLTDNSQQALRIQNDLKEDYQNLKMKVENQQGEWREKILSAQNDSKMNNKLLFQQAQLLVNIKRTEQQYKNNILKQNRLLNNKVDFLTEKAKEYQQRLKYAGNSTIMQNQSIVQKQKAEKLEDNEGAQEPSNQGQTSRALQTFQEKDMERLRLGPQTQKKELLSISQLKSKHSLQRQSRVISTTILPQQGLSREVASPRKSQQ